MPEKNESNRRRKWAPKARTGCRTCKTRHVKCDETKPICRRCILSGVRCDGYVSSSTNDNNQDHSSVYEDAVESPKTSSPGCQSSHALAVIRTSIPTQSPSSPKVSASLLINPSEPYVNGERHSLRYFMELTSAMVGRSRSGPYFWQILVPQVAWSYASVRHAMMATAVSCESLINRSDANAAKQAELQVLRHTSQAVQALLYDRPPLDVVLLTSATLAILDLFKGEWGSACTHITFGAKLAKQARFDSQNDPYIAFYCEAFASALPNVLKRAEDRFANPCPVEKNSIVRLTEAVRSLRLAMSNMDQAMHEVEHVDPAERLEITRVIQNSRSEIEWLLTRWEALLHKELRKYSPTDDELQINLHRIESPWSAVLTGLNSYLKQGGAFDVNKFEVAMERTMPFYAFAKAGSSLAMRQDAAHLLYNGIKMRGRKTLSVSSPLLTSLITDPA